MRDLALRVPRLFVDLHEDGETAHPYVYRYVKDDNDFASRLQQLLGAADEPWADSAEWRGASEVYIKSLGCSGCATVEVPPVWSMADRIDWQIRAIRWCANIGIRSIPIRLRS